MRETEIVDFSRTTLKRAVAAAVRVELERQGPALKRADLVARFRDKGASRATLYRWVESAMAAPTAEVGEVQLPAPVTQIAGALRPFVFEDASIRVVDQVGTPWFVAVDVAHALCIANSRDALAKLDADEKGVGSVDTLGGRQYVQLIAESGLYALILRSRQATTPGSVAHRFRRWVTSEVLPAVRRKGGYTTGAEHERAGELSENELVLRAMVVLQTRAARLTTENAAMAPKVEALDRLEGSEGSRCMTVAAKELKLQPRELIRLLAARSWIYRRGGSEEWVGYQRQIEAGMLEHRPVRYRDRGGVERSRTQVLVTDKGLATLATMLSSANAA
ncbi:phage antirepressor [Paracraurococcus lichenis]|uniref:Phage antirepressor KilAC domain-containing protein n=1 Tax=Paracraurococcus lichenis TaxID=3064888 RepID=A0ABT9EDP8_9PROT|nr:phage antirepressor KilAC domain-containing protein [Paracraurococcus sp. LOR1-02]MDO9714224.1 phage antirepressor KilAC domain-containing protein [Paracraurococcus sp. LOR1-02]